MMLDVQYKFLIRWRWCWMMLADDVDGSISQFLCFCVYAVAIYAGTYGSCVEIMNWWEFFHYYLSFLEIKPFYTRRWTRIVNGMNWCLMKYKIIILNNVSDNHSHPLNECWRDTFFGDSRIYSPLFSVWSGTHGRSFWRKLNLSFFSFISLLTLEIQSQLRLADDDEADENVVRLKTTDRGVNTLSWPSFREIPFNRVIF